MVRRASIILYAVVMTALVIWKFVDIENSYRSAGKPVSIVLSRGPFTVLEFPSKMSQTRAIILFGSGDGGWSGFEEQICIALQDHGYDVIGINSNAYAVSDYSLAVLQADFDKIAQTAEMRFGSHPVPLILGGWSMGAAQAIASAGGPNPPAYLVGLLVLDPCSRGRYGLRVSDQMDLSPTGPGTFSVDSFSGAMPNLRVVQWHAAEDSIDSRAWLASLTAPHKVFVFENTGHYYNTDRGEFLRQLVNCVPWILQPKEKAATSSALGRVP